MHGPCPLWCGVVVPVTDAGPDPISALTEPSLCRDVTMINRMTVIILSTNYV